MSVQHRAGIRIDGDATGFRAATQDAGKSARSLEEQVGRVTESVRRVGHYGAGLLILKQAFDFGRGIANTADEMSTLATRIKLVTTSSEQQLRIQSRLFDVAQASRVSYTELGGTYAQISRSTSALGVSHERLLGVVQSISQAMTIGGGSAESMRAALVQLSQGLASGTLRGDELNSILEQTPRLAQAIANGLGVGVGKLREMGAEGKLQAQQIIAALENQAGALKAEFDQVQKTIGGGVTEVSNATSLLIGNLNQVSGAGASMANVLGTVAGQLSALARSKEGLEAVTVAMKTLVTAGTAYIALGLGRFIAGKAAAMKDAVAGAMQHVAAMQAEQAAASASAAAQISQAQATLAQQAATAQAIVAERALVVARMERARTEIAAANAAIAASRAAGAQSFALATLRASEEALAAAQAQRTAATTALVVLGQQQTRVKAAETAATTALAVAEGKLAAARGAGAAAATLGARALAFLGGPIGAVTTLLTVGATAWMLWGNSAREGEAKAKGEVRKSTEEVIADLNQQIAKLRERNELARLAKRGGVEPTDPLAQDYARALKEYQDAIAGRGQYANLQGAAREDIIKKLGERFGRLAASMREFNAEQNAVTLAAGGDKAGAWMEKYATRAEKMQVELKKARDELGIHFTPEIEQRIRKAFAEPGAEKAGNDRMRIYKQISDELDAHMQSAGLELAMGRQLTQVESDRLKLMQEIGEHQRELGPQLAAELRARVEARSVVDQQIEQSRQLAAVAEEERTLRMRAGQAAIQQAEALLKGNEALKAEVEQIGLNAAELYQLEQQRLADALATKEQRYERLMAGQATTMETEALRIEIEALKERRELLTKGRGRTLNKELADASAEQRKRDEEDAKRREELLAESIGNGILEGTRDGASLMKVFRDELKAQFAKTVLRPVISPMVSATNKVLDMLMGQVGGLVKGLVGDGDPYAGGWTGEHHGGGVIGQDAPRRMRWMPDAAFAAAPRLHGGRLAPDEYPAILQRRESVLTPAQMSMLAPAGQPPLQITLINQGGEPLQAQSARTRPDGSVEVLMTAIKESIAGDIGSGTGPVTRALQGRYGLRPGFSS